MAFSNQKKSPPLTEILRLEDAAFVSLVKKMLEGSHPSAWTMCVVAYQNLHPMLQACKELSQEPKAKDVPVDLDSFITMVSVRFQENEEEIPKRRLGWIYQAALIQRATGIASRRLELQSEAADVWIMLAKGAANLSELLPPNILWSDDEKAYFTDIKNQKDGIWYCLQILTPAFLKKNSHFISFAESQNIFVI